MAEISFILEALLIFCQYFALVALSVHYNDDFVALNVITANVAFEGGNLCVEFALKFMNFLLNFFKLMLIVLIDCLELLFFQRMNFFLKLFNSFIFKNIDNLLDLRIFAKLFSEQVPHHGAGSIHIGQIADHN